jgi:uncharacterized protein YceK
MIHHAIAALKPTWECDFFRTLWAFFRAMLTFWPLLLLALALGALGGCVSVWNETNNYVMDSRGVKIETSIAADSRDNTVTPNTEIDVPVSALP